MAGTCEGVETVGGRESRGAGVIYITYTDRLFSCLSPEAEKYLTFEGVA